MKRILELIENVWIEGSILNTVQLNPVIAKELESHKSCKLCKGSKKVSPPFEVSDYDNLDCPACQNNQF